MASMAPWSAWPESPSSLGPLTSRAAGRGFLATVLARPILCSVEHGGDLVFHPGQYLDNIADALAGEILEIAGLVDFHRMLLNILGKPALVLVLERGAERPRAVVDGFRRVQDRLRGPFHGVDRGAELAGRASHAAILLSPIKRRQVVLVAGDFPRTSVELEFARSPLHRPLGSARKRRVRRPARAPRRAEHLLDRKTLRCTPRPSLPQPASCIPAAINAGLLGNRAGEERRVYHDISRFTQNKL